MIISETFSTEKRGVGVRGFQKGFDQTDVANTRTDQGRDSGVGGAPLPRLLTPEETAGLLGVTVRWLYTHADRFTFTRRLSRKVLRFHEEGVRRYVEKGRP